VINLFVLMGVAALCTVLSGWAIRRCRKTSAWQNGMIYGLVCVVVMFTPVVTHSGFIVDCRVGVIGVASLIGGPVMGLTSLILPMAYRLYVGGDRVMFGLLELFFACSFGLLFHLLLRREQRKLTLPCALCCSVAVGLLTDLAMVIAFMPDIFLLNQPGLGLPGILVVILIAPLSMVVLSSMILLEKGHFEAMDAVAEIERRMLYSQKMAALGQLSNKLAHSILNSLAVIMGNAEVVKVEKENSPVVAECMDSIVEKVNHLSTMTGELIAFASPGMLRFRKTDLSKCLVGIDNLLGKVIGSGVEVVIHGDQHAGEVMVDLNRLEQIIMHLVINAVEAMAGSGELTITVAPARLSQLESMRLQAGVSEKKRHMGAFAMLSVQDNGCGMSRETVARIFEPFFTTKEDRDNAGLGLSTVYNIVQQHHGFIDVKSNPGKGTVFSVYFPVYS